MQCKHRVSLCKRGAACGNAHFFFHTKNKYLSNAEQYKLEKSHRKCPWIRQCCQNVIAAKNIIYICFWQTLTEIWSVKDPIILGLSQTAHPMIGGAAKIACYLLLNIRCWKLIKNWMWASKMARYLCSNTSVGASLGRNLASVGSCGHLLITALPIASILSIFYTHRYRVL